MTSRTSGTTNFLSQKKKIQRQYSPIVVTKSFEMGCHFVMRSPQSLWVKNLSSFRPRKLTKQKKKGKSLIILPESKLLARLAGVGGADGCWALPLDVAAGVPVVVPAVAVVEEEPVLDTDGLGEVNDSGGDAEEDEDCCWPAENVIS